jgi:hypothetical protein
VLQRSAVGTSQVHEDARHQWEMEAHVELVALAEGRTGIFGPHVGLGEQHGARRVGIGKLAGAPQIGLGLRQVISARAIPLEDIRCRVHASAIHAQVGPELHDAHHGPLDLRMGVVQIGLMGAEPAPGVVST